MFKITYITTLDKKDNELAWLKSVKVYPAYRDIFRNGTIVAAFGVIVNDETALTIKLRHKLDTQQEYPRSRGAKSNEL